MALTYGFYNSVNHDRKYTATDMSRLFDGILNDGVFMTVGEKFMVEASSGMAISVGTGRAWFNRTWTNNDAKLIISTQASELVLNRIDAVVLEVDTNEAIRTNSIKVIKGVPASIPIRPELTKSESLNQWALAYILIPAGATSILQENISCVVGMEETPFVTGLMQTNNLDGLYQQWEALFNDWFEKLQANLSGNVAVELQNQVNKLSILFGDGPPNEVSGSSGQFYLNLAAEPKPLLYQLSNGVWSTVFYEPIGTIKQSVRTDLGPTWALCNGAGVDKNLYPDLYNLVKNARIGVNIVYNDYTVPGLRPDELCKIGNKYAYLSWSADADQNLILYTSNILTGGWNETTIETTAKSGWRKPKICHDSTTGVTCIVAEEYVKSSSKNDKTVFAFICTEPSLSVWTKTTIVANVKTGWISSLSLANGYFICSVNLGASSGVASDTIYYLASTGAGGWSSSSLNNVISGAALRILSETKYVNGKYYMLAEAYVSTANIKLYVLSTHSLTNNSYSIKKAIDEISTSGESFVLRPTLLRKGSLLIYAYNKNGVQSKSGTTSVIFYNVDTDAIYRKTLVTFNTSATSSNTLGYILSNDILVVSYYQNSKVNHVYCLSPTGTDSDIWTEDISVTHTNALYYKPNFDDNIPLGISSQGIMTSDLPYLSFKLPVIESQAYKYIKIKED